MHTLLRTTLLLALSGILAGVVAGQTPTTTIQNGSGAPRLQLNYDGGLLVPGTFGPTAPADSIPATGAGTRLMWYPAKAAFRAGRVFDNTAIGFGVDGRTFWDPANVGNYSVAFGNNTTASANMSLAAGINTVASAPNATALGAGTEASGEAATAMGESTIANAPQATAMGFDTRADSKGAVAMGRETEATGAQAVATGTLSKARGKNSVAMGEETTASGTDATAMGESTTASGDAATAMGFSTTASGLSATAMGEATTASGGAATAIGISTIGATNASLSIGRYNSANTSSDNTLFVAGNGEVLDRADALVLDQSGNLEISGTLTEGSDRRLKTSIRPLEGETLAKLSRLRPVRYQFKNQQTHPSGEQIGLVAQDVRAEFPSLVSTSANDMLSLSYSKFTAVLLKGLQEQQQQIDTQTEKIAALRAENEAIQTQQKRLQERLAALEAQSSGSILASTSSVSGLLLALLALGGLLGTGLLWRYRP